MLRVDPGSGRGHHRHVVTAGTESKFGVPPQDLPIVWDICDRHNIEVMGLHACWFWDSRWLELGVRRLNYWHR